MAGGLDGIVATETILSLTDQVIGMVWVRGCDLPTLVERHGFEGTVALLWDGFAGAGLMRAGLTRCLGQARLAAYAASPGWLPQSAGRTLFEGMRIALAAQPDAASPAAVVGALAVAVPALVGRRRGSRRCRPTQRYPPPPTCCECCVAPLRTLPRSLRWMPISQSWQKAD